MLVTSSFGEKHPKCDLIGTLEVFLIGFPSKAAPTGRVVANKHIP